MSSDDILVSLGILAGVGLPSTETTVSDACFQDTPYPTGVLLFLFTMAVIPWFLLGMLTYKFRTVWAQYFRDQFEYVLAIRTDLEYKLTYEMFVGDELHSTVVISSDMPQRLANGDADPPGAISADIELREVVVRP